MNALASVVALGFLLGMRHATDADHVAAVATIVSRERSLKVAAWVGALWGLGHTLTLVLVGVPIVVFNWAVAPRLGLAMEFAVGLMLILLGFRNLSGARWPGNSLPDPGQTGAVASHPDDQREFVHSHKLGHVLESHQHSAGETPLRRMDLVFGGLGVYQAARPIVVGIVHGLAGSAAIALLVLTTIDDVTWGLLYLLVFGVGTVVGMVLITTAIAVPFAGTATRSVRTHHYLRAATGLVSVGFGVFLAYEIGVVQGLFSAAPLWIPK